MNAKDYEVRNERLGQLCVDQYQHYLDSETWGTRKFIYELDHAKRCSFCGVRESVDLHHRSYDRLGHETDDDLVWLCRSHHQEFHDYGQMPTRPTEEQIYILEEIGCTRATIKALSKREAARRINAEQQRFLRGRVDPDDALIITERNLAKFVKQLSSDM